MYDQVCLIQAPCLPSHPCWIRVSIQSCMVSRPTRLPTSSQMGPMFQDPDPSNPIYRCRIRSCVWQIAVYLGRQAGKQARRDLLSTLERRVAGPLAYLVTGAYPKACMLSSLHIGLRLCLDFHTTMPA
ncbi:hypothetical protein B0T17DRAFT_72726 [Bombardia bombarda]|uniref:Uncharacterized protein n=1 Tax=Bombardia bombarda TaxID=252184 RepID=A0AA40CG36_9PEZI|nr:hypothetical protein B0T17DRAFT_72726 [Bombardia bombarda]